VVLGAPLLRSRPLWSATFVTGLADGGTGLVIGMNYVLADGIGGLAILVDESAGMPLAGPHAVPFPVSAPRGQGRWPPTPGQAGRGAWLTCPQPCARSGRAWLSSVEPAASATLAAVRSTT
jgi:diacylglycerol O-acyltransferase / wax synthase